MRGEILDLFVSVWGKSGNHDNEANNNPGPPVLII
jgi:hypothetical protein